MVNLIFYCCQNYLNLSVSYEWGKSQLQRQGLKVTYNLFQNQKSTNTAFYLENTTDNVANFCF
jgi:hypothetical protein